MSTIALHCPARPVTPVAATFHAEVDLAEHVRAWLTAQRDVVGVGDEINAGSGIADLVAGCATDQALPTRPTLLNPLAVHVMEAAQNSVAEDDLRRWAPHGWRSLHRRVLEPLLAGGQLTMTRDSNDLPSYTAAVVATDPFSSLIAVELKLRDWRRAVAQAGRYRLFAERAFLGMPAHRMTLSLQSEARRNHVGVLAVHDSGHVEMVEPAPRAVPLQPSRRRWASEQLLSALRDPGARTAGSPIR